MTTSAGMMSGGDPLNPSSLHQGGSLEGNKGQMQYQMVQKQTGQSIEKQVEHIFTEADDDEANESASEEFDQDQLEELEDDKNDGENLSEDGDDSDLDDEIPEDESPPK